MAFVYFCRQGTFRAVTTEEIAAVNADGPFKKYLPLPDGFKAEVGNVWDRSGNRIKGELPNEYTDPKDRTPGIVTWDAEGISGNITQYPVLMDLAKQLLTE